MKIFEYLIECRYVILDIIVEDLLAMPFSNYRD